MKNVNEMVERKIQQFQLDTAESQVREILNEAGFYETAEVMSFRSDTVGILCTVRFGKHITVQIEIRTWCGMWESVLPRKEAYVFRMGSIKTEVNKILDQIDETIMSLAYYELPNREKILREVEKIQADDPTV